MAVLIVGLGNPGKKYELTRHNAGFIAVDHLADSWELTWKTDAQARAEVAETNVDGIKVILAKPQTFMNLSGESVASLCGKYKIAAKDVWVVFDDIDITPSQIRIRVGGGSGGHNGIKSIVGHIGADFARFKIGIGAQPEHMPLEDYVLQKLNKIELELLKKKVQIIEEIIERSLTSNITEETITIA